MTWHGYDNAYMKFIILWENYTTQQIQNLEHNDKRHDMVIITCKQDSEISWHFNYQMQHGKTNQIQNVIIKWREA